MAALSTPPVILAHVELGIWIIAGSTLLASIIGGAFAVAAALIARQNRRKLNTPGEGTIGEKVQRVADKG